MDNEIEDSVPKQQSLTKGGGLLIHPVLFVLTHTLLFSMI